MSDLTFKEAAAAIKDAIVRSRYQAAKLINKELLSLYYSVGKYVSENSCDGYWGQGAIKQISDTLQRELPGLRGFSESSIKRMREFYEQWVVVFSRGCNKSSILDSQTTIYSGYSALCTQYVVGGCNSTKLDSPQKAPNEQSKISFPLHWE
jgi:hypothetical protein